MLDAAIGVDDVTWSSPNVIGESGLGGTQHRSEAAALLTTAGRSPGDLGLLDYAEGLASRGS